MVNNSVEDRLNDFEGKRIKIIQDGFLQSKYSIQELEYFIEDEILNITDVQTGNYLNINLNQVYKLEIEDNSIKFYLDNDTMITLYYKKEDRQQ